MNGEGQSINIFGIFDNCGAVNVLTKAMQGKKRFGGRDRGKDSGGER